ncbi:hypothetical protein DBR06_SOUSAS3810108, partial [Sousa chinensis]
KDSLSASSVEAFLKGTALKSYQVQTGPLNWNSARTSGHNPVVQRGQARSDDSR